MGDFAWGANLRFPKIVASSDSTIFGIYDFYINITEGPAIRPGVFLPFSVWTDGDYVQI